MPRMTEKEIAGIVEEEILQGEGGEYGSTSLQENRRLAWNYYLGRSRGDEDPDRSQLQSLDVADQTEHLLGQLMQAFAGTDCPAEFEPSHPNDDSQCMVESDAVNKILMEDNDGFETIYCALKNALLFKNGFIKVYVQNSTDHETVTYDNLSGDEAALLEASLPEGATAEGDDDSVTISLDRDRKKLIVEAIEPASFVYESNWHKQDLQDIRFCGERKFFTRSELLGMGFSPAKVNKLPALTMDTKPDTYTKNLDQVGGDMDSTTRGEDKIECYEVYINLPRNLNRSNNESERYRIFQSNRVILDKELTTIVPYVTGCIFLVPHRMTGLSLYDKLSQIQDSKTAAIRQFADNQNHINNGRFFVQGDVNREELGVSAPGHHITGGMASNLTPIPMIDQSQGSIAFLNYCDKIRAERGGAALDMGSPESQLVSSSIGASGVAMVMGAQEQMAGFMTRTISETLIRRLFLLIHRTAREVWRRPMMMRRADKWERIDPGQWRRRTRVSVKTGLSPGERARKVSNLATVLQTQLGLMQAGFGGSMVNEKGIYRAWMNWAKAAELDNPEQYALHYESDESQQAQQQKGQMQQQAQQQAQQAAEIDPKMKLVIAQMEDKRERDLAILKSEIEEMKVLGRVTGELEIEQLRARNARESAGNNGANGGN